MWFSEERIVSSIVAKYCLQRDSDNLVKGGDLKTDYQSRLVSHMYFTDTELSMISSMYLLLTCLLLYEIRYLSPPKTTLSLTNLEVMDGYNKS